MSVVPPEFGLPPALFAHNGGLRQSTSALQLRDAFPAAFIRTRTIRPLSAFPACRYYFSSSLLLLVTHAITFFPVCQGKFIALLQPAPPIITATQRINTTTETVYYLVEGTGKDMEVTTWTGYNNAPSNYTVERAYAVTSYVADNTRDKWNNALPYEVAEVVVIESTKDTGVPNAYLGISLEQKLFGMLRTATTSRSPRMAP